MDPLIKRAYELVRRALMAGFQSGGGLARWQGFPVGSEAAIKADGNSTEESLRPLPTREAALPQRPALAPKEPVNDPIPNTKPFCKWGDRFSSSRLHSPPLTHPFTSVHLPSLTPSLTSTHPRSPPLTFPGQGAPRLSQLSTCAKQA